MAKCYTKSEVSSIKGFFLPNTMEDNQLVNVSECVSNYVDYEMYNLIVNGVAYTNGRYLGSVFEGIPIVWNISMERYSYVYKHQTHIDAALRNGNTYITVCIYDKDDKLYQEFRETLPSNVFEVTVLPEFFGSRGLYKCVTLAYAIKSELSSNILEYASYIGYFVDRDTYAEIAEWSKMNASSRN